MRGREITLLTLLKYKSQTAKSNPGTSQCSVATAL